MGQHGQRYGVRSQIGDATAHDAWLQCPRKAEVAQILRHAETHGGSLLKPAHDIFWGGRSGFFADPDGHMWEVAFNPFSPVAEDGGFHWSTDA